MTKNEKLILGIGIGIPLITFVFFIVYWFGVRDTWETDNYTQITARCNMFELAISKSDDNETAQAYKELNRFVGDHKLEMLASRVESAKKEIIPVHIRLEKMRQEVEAQELAKKQAREAQEKEDRRRRIDEEYARRPKEKYYRDSHGALISESEAEGKLAQIRRNVYAMPDNAERAYYEGVLRAAESEWYRVKAQGPINQ